ncbi:MAG: efflux RND transporter periplasmic adaptor subunit [Oscillospiraceae bacterium]|jgi:RND family efflux transporter MFP subunit|nr:efflux RND transporter periplasmic adaptor subunit [Oscillospiraceae bacterium]
MKKAKRAAAVLLALGLALGLWGCGAKTTENTLPANAAKQVTKGNLIVGLTADGTVALPVTNLNFEVSGTVSKLYVAAGDTVEKGDLLLELDGTDYQLDIETARNNLEKAQNNYADALWNYAHSLKSDKLSLQNTKALLGDSFDSYDYDAAVAAAAYNLEKRQKELAQAEKNAIDPYDATKTDRELSDAQALLTQRATELVVAQSEELHPFDDTDYQRKIKDAEATLEEKEQAYYDAIGAENEAAAQKAYEAARTSLSRLKEDLNQAKAKARSEASTKTATALKNYNSANEAVQRLKQDIATAKSDAADQSVDDLAAAKQAVADAETSLAKAQKNLATAKQNFVKDIGNYELALDSYEQAQKGSASVSNAKSSVREMELLLEEAENKLQQTKITSPIDGQIISLTKKEGEKVSASSNANTNMMFGTSGSSSSVVTVCDLSEVYLTANITEGDIVGVEQGQTVKVQIDSIGDESFPGKVVSISSLPSTDSSGITTYTVTVKLDAPNASIKDGMTALCTFVRLEHEDVLMAPNKAIFLEDGVQYVYVIGKQDQLEKREVSCGLTNGTETEVLSGLKEGETVSTSPAKAVSEK